MYQFSIMNFIELFRNNLDQFYRSETKNYDTPDKKIDIINKKLRLRV